MTLGPVDAKKLTAEVAARNGLLVRERRFRRWRLSRCGNTTGGTGSLRIVKRLSNGWRLYESHNSVCNPWEWIIRLRA